MCETRKERKDKKWVRGTYKYKIYQHFLELELNTISSRSEEMGHFLRQRADGVPTMISHS